MKVVALTGGSGSGKSTVLNGLAQHFIPNISILSLDNYYRPKSELPVDENGETNFDLPEALDHAALLRDIKLLKSGQSVSFETYTYNRDKMAATIETIEPKEWLIVEGLFILHLPEVRELIDVTAFLDASPKTRLERRKKRDLEVRGYSHKEVEYQWENHVRPADIKYIEPWKEKCDVVIDNEHDCAEGLSKLIRLMEK